MNGRKYLSIRLAVCVLVPALSVAVPAIGDTHYVSPGQSIQAAIDDANDGDDIEVAPGIYNEAINFNGKAVRLYSSGGPEVTTIDANGAYHVVQCVCGEDANTILEGFTITGGNAGGTDSNSSGGGMYNDQSSPTVTNCTFTGNTATTNGGGMYNNASNPAVTNCTFSSNSASNGSGMCNYTNSRPTVTNCTFTDNANCGMYNNGSSPTVTDCTFTGNSASHGGGMGNHNSSPTVTDCKFTANTATVNAGGMYNYNSHPTVTNCTFTGNTASSETHGGAGMWNHGSSPTVTNCTFTGNTATTNGGGMYNYTNSYPTVTNCILWGNTPDGIFNSGGNATATYSDVQGGYGGTGNIDADPCFVDAAGGNWRLSDWSPCVDAGNNNDVPVGVTTDLDGNPRFVDDASVADTGAGTAPIVDMGAYERQMNSVGPIYNVTRGFYYLQIQAAIDAAVSGDEIEVAAGTYNEAIDFKGKAIRLYSTDGPNNTTIDGTGNYHVVQCVSGEDANTILDGFTITGGNAIGDGSGYPYNHTYLGGGMFNFNSNPTVTNCTFTDLEAYDGGGISNYDNSSPTITNCTFSDNTANSSGGGMQNTLNSNPSVVNCTFSNNEAEYFGGGMYNYNNSSPTVTNCTFSGNSLLDGYGGGMCNHDNSSPTVTDCNFSDNESGRDGGGMCNFTNSSPTVTNCTFSNNETDKNGGGMCNNNGSSPTVTNCTFSSNWCSFRGGGMNNDTNSSPTVTNCIFSGNRAGMGGGMGNNESSPTVTNCTFTSNTAIAYVMGGAGMYNISSSPTVTNCTFTGNKATADGGGMFNYTNSSPTVTNCILWNNAPDEIFNNGGTPTVTYSNVDGGYGGAGNINKCPMFFDATAGDLRLNWYSLCVDSGDNNAPYLPATDLAGNDRVMDGDGDGNPVVDMGAYELEAGMFKVAVGTLAVTIEPNEAIDTGAKWKVEGVEQWYNSGDVVTLPPGYYEVEVNELGAWYEPKTLAVGYDTVDSNEVPQQSLWVRVIGDMNATATAEYKPLPVFAIGDIPPRDVPHGRKLEFGVDANWLGDDVSYSLTMTFDPNYPEPEGLILIDPCSGLFTYEPNDANDWAPFLLTFTAASGVDVNEQTVKITPIPDLPPEYTIFTEPVQDWPDPCDHIFVNEILSDEPQFLNGIEHTEVLSVTVSGKYIEVADVPYNPVYVYSGNLDINDLTIYAETVVISDPLSLPQTRVAIYARELIFEGAADINTTPEDGRPVGTEELDGLSAADISLYIESYEADGGLNGRLIMGGTRGYNGGSPGEDGVLTCTLDNPQPLAWLTPYALKMVIAHAKDAYLYSYTGEAHDILSEYAGLLTAYRALPEWNELDGDWQYEFGQMHQEVITLLHRLENGLDYFGNPPGWTPMLSFEVWKAAYEDEIERGIRVLYLSYWLQHIADDANSKADALAEGRSKLWDETVQFKEDYQTVADIIETLKTEAANIVNTVGGCNEAGCWGLLGELTDKEVELLERADRIVEDRHKVPWWKAAINSIGTAYTSTLKGFASGGKAGGAAAWELERIRIGGEIIDELFRADDPFAVLSNRAYVADRFNSISKDLGQAYDGCFQVFDDIEDLSDIEGGAEGYLSALKGSTSKIAAGLYDVKEALMATSLDNEEVQTELAKLKASDPTFGRLVDKAFELMVQKEVFNRQLAAAMQKVSTLSNGITNNILAIDSMNRQASLQNRVFDRRALMYVKDMELRARARLLKYHYYMAKAYEYRTLERYEWPLDIQDVFDNIVTMAKGKPNGILSPTDYDTIKAVYDELFSDIRDHILAQYDYGDEVTSELLTYLSADQLAQLNAGQTATIDLIDRIDVEEENVRVVDMSVVEASLDAIPAYPGSTDCQNAYVTVRVEHSGVCNLQKDEDMYQFSYPETNISWASKCYVTGEIIDDTPSYASESMLRALLPDLSDAQVMFYSRPALWADISMHRNLNQMNDCTDVEITSLRLSIMYDYLLRSETPDYVTLHVGTFPQELRPYFTLDKTDQSEAGRQDGIGDFYRTYITGTSVTVTAPERYGDYKFWGWYRKEQTPLYSYDRVLEVNWMTQGGRLYTVEAKYEYVGPLCAGDVNADLNVDLRDFSSLAAAWLTELGDERWDEYCDISDPPDYVIDEFDLKVLCENWLATP